MERGIFVLVVGSSGSGKNTLIEAAREANRSLAFAVSATTRPMREGEVDGVNYHFLTNDEFSAKIHAGEFLEWAAYGGNRYGTLRSELEPKLALGKLILKDIEVQGVRQIRSILPREEYRTIFIDAGSWEELVARIQLRAPMSEAELLARHTRYDDERTFMSEADHVVSNKEGELDSAKAEFIRIVTELGA